MQCLNEVEFRSKCIVCALFTLFSHDKKFRVLNNTISSTAPTRARSTSLLYNQQLCYLKDLLNKPLTRKLACRILRPLLENNTLTVPPFQNQLQQQYDETLLLKKYFKKFRFNYYRYYYSSSYPRERFQIKKLNLIALNMLLLLAGV